MCSTWFWDFLVLFLLAPPTLAFSRGATRASCQEMVPGHIRAQPQDPKLPHVTLKTSASSYLPGQLVTVTVRSSRDFMGFLLQARAVEGTDRVTTGHKTKDRTKTGSGARVRSTRLGPVLLGGSWTFTPPGTHTLHCLSEDDTLTHSDKQLKRNLSFVWKAPDVPMGDVKFYITVVQSYFVYWAGIESAVVHDGSRSPRSWGSTTTTTRYKPEETQIRVTFPILDMKTSGTLASLGLKRLTNQSDDGQNRPTTLRPHETSTAQGLHPVVPTEALKTSTIPDGDLQTTAPLALVDGQETEATTRTPEKTTTTKDLPTTSYSFNNTDPPRSTSQNPHQTFSFYQDFTLTSSSSRIQVSKSTSSTLSTTTQAQPQLLEVPSQDQNLSTSPKPKTSPDRPHPQTAEPPEPTTLTMSPKTQTEGQVDFPQTDRPQSDQPPSTQNALGVSSRPLTQAQTQSGAVGAQTSRWESLRSSGPPQSMNPLQFRTGSESTYALNRSKIKTTSPTFTSSPSNTPSLSVALVHPRSTSPRSTSEGPTTASKQTSSTQASSSPSPTSFALKKHARTRPALSAPPNPSPISIPPQFPSIQPSSTTTPPSFSTKPFSISSPGSSSSKNLTFPLTSSTISPSSTNVSAFQSTSPHPEPSPALRRSHNNPLASTSSPEPSRKLTRGQRLLIQSYAALSDPELNPNRATLNTGLHQDPAPRPNLVAPKPNPANTDAKPKHPPGTVPKEGKYPDKPRHSVWELGMLLGCSAGLGTVLVVGVRYVYRKACGKRTGVTLNDREREPGRRDRGLIHVQECGDLVRVRRIRENSFVLLAEYDILTPPGD